MVQPGLIIVTVLLLAVIIAFRIILKPRKKNISALPESMRSLLQLHVPYYQHLSADGKMEFERRMQGFLSSVTLTGVKTEVTELDRVYVGASAIIPLFGFPHWEYLHLDEILLYPGSFNDDFAQEGANRDTLGMVGNGPMEDVMILSREDLRNGFENKSGKNNTAIHEFTHLIDKEDGTIDGVPDVLLAHQYVRPWVEMMHKQIREIMANRSDINPYGATNPAEFLAVVAEYFFERPDLLKEKHPQLYELLSTIFRQQPIATSKR